MPVDFTVKHLCGMSRLLANIHTKHVPDYLPHAFQYNIEGERLTRGEIQERRPKWLCEGTVNHRLAKGKNTWAELFLDPKIAQKRNGKRFSDMRKKSRERRKLIAQDKAEHFKKLREAHGEV